MYNSNTTIQKKRKKKKKEKDHKAKLGIFLKQCLEVQLNARRTILN